MSERSAGGGGAPGDAGPVDAATRHGDGEAPGPGEEELFAALDRTRADLAAAPRPAAPAGFADALAAAVAAERAAGTTDGGAAGPGPTRSPRVGRPRRRRFLAAGLLAAAAAAVVVGVLGVSAGGPAPSPAPTAAPSPAPDPGRPVVLASGELPRAWRSGLGARDGGPLADPAARTGCLVAHGLPAGTVPVGARAVVLDGRPGTLYVLPTGRAAEFRLLVVGPDCAPGSPDGLADVTVGG
ncbi:hypothetical protein [Actinomycetospora termitidis]|uniref:Anti-sigma-M factor RsmA n=1 Tax=Actinomycetospora termitidis TaxID=3053470 RepID=A0ABT7M2I3_9PSEU|nr:hypothetical protein [Actinomycetospora sp. Odt1-22]MDL5154864.1 hypothetical protein [Actinomycetospora sp. Odt1-22]